MPLCLLCFVTVCAILPTMLFSTYDILSTMLLFCAILPTMLLSTYATLPTMLFSMPFCLLRCFLCHSACSVFCLLCQSAIVYANLPTTLFSVSILQLCCFLCHSTCFNENYKIPMHCFPTSPESRYSVSPTKILRRNFQLAESAQHISGLGIFINNRKNLYVRMVVWWTTAIQYADSRY